MNIFKEIKNGINEMDTIQEQLTSGEKTVAIIVTVHILGYIFLGITEGFVWATVSYMIYATLMASVFMWYIVAKEIYYIAKRILNNMEGMW